MARAPPPAAVALDLELAVALDLELAVALDLELAVALDLELAVAVDLNWLLPLGGAALQRCDQASNSKGFSPRAPDFALSLLTPSMITLTEDDVRQRLDPAKVITAIEAAFRDRYPSTVIPNRTHLPTTFGVFLIMPCHDRAANAMGMKLVAVQDKPARPEDRIQATYLLFDSETAGPRLVASANYLTDLRTAATSAVATKFLAREDARVLGIFGTGRQACAHIQVLPLVRRLERVLVCGHDPTQVREFATKMSEEVRLPVESTDAATCAGQSDVLCTCTTCQVPLFDGKVLRPGTHLNLVGAFQPHAREVDSRTVQRAHIVVDTYDSALAEAGDLLIPIKEGLISRDHIAADLNELLTGKKAGRKNPSEITLFKSVGCALEDLATAELLES